MEKKSGYQTFLINLDKAKRKALKLEQSNSHDLSRLAHLLKIAENTDIPLVTREKAVTAMFKDMALFDAALDLDHVG